jgi:RimJ/RimL family protein N-acetyltransferase
MLSFWLISSRVTDVNFDDKAIHKEANADLSITLLKGMSIKFHIRPVYEVIALEVKTGHVVPIPEDYFEKALAAESPTPPSTSKISLPSNLAGSVCSMVFPPPADSDFQISSLLSDPVPMEHLAAMAKLSAGGWSVDDAAARRLRQTTEFNSGSSMNGAIYASPGGEFAGIGGFRSIDWWSRSAEMGIILSPSFWRRGISIEVHYLCFVYAFEELCLNRIEFKTASSNTAMVKFCKDILGANHDGTLRDAFPATYSIDAFRLYSDVEIFSVVASEWPALKIQLQNRMSK